MELTPRTIRIAAALIDDDQGRLLLVRKIGTPWFMQAGGKIEHGESTITALQRELREEIGFSLEGKSVCYLGCFTAPAANEPDHLVEAEIFHIRAAHLPMAAGEIEEAIWVEYAAAQGLNLAPLTRNHVLPLARGLQAQSSDGQRDARPAG